MICCQNCFNCEFVNTHITLKSVSIGDCEGCGSLNVSLIDSLELTDLFSPLFDLYKPSELGLPLLDLVRGDWKLFDKVPDQRMVQIFKGMIYGDKDVTLKYTPIIKDSELFNWELFKEELKHENRFFPVSFPEQQELSSLLSYLSMESEHEQQELYRARINKNISEPYPIADMGSPPKELATSGRANPVGISYLYVASTIKTAISEVRPHKGDYLTIAKFVGNRALKLVDLRDPRSSILPFRYSESSLRNAYKGLSLLETLGDELTKPVSLHKAQLEYLSSQYLCEFIKSQGYEGVIYKSSLGQGDNYAIFDEKYLRGTGTQLVEITAIDISHSDNLLDNLG